MPRTPKAMGRQVHALAPKLAELIAAEVKARSGPNTTFEDEQDLATAVLAEVLAELAKRDPKGER